MSTRRVLLARHCEVEERYRGVCYGCSDVSLSERGRRESEALALRLAREPVTLVCHSGLSRARVVAESLAERLGQPAQECPRLRERDYGAWELRTWDDLYAETGDAMLGSVRAPATWRPPGGETTFEMRDRVLAWFYALPAAGVIVAVTHGGPIAALRGALRDQGVEGWPSLIPAPGEVVEL